MPTYIPNDVARLRYTYSPTQGNIIACYGAFTDQRDEETGLYLDMHRRIHLLVQGKHNSYAGFVDNWREDTIHFPAEVGDIIIVLAYESEEFLGMVTYQIVDASPAPGYYQQVLMLINANIPVEIECLRASDESMQRWQERIQAGVEEKVKNGSTT